MFKDIKRYFFKVRKNHIKKIYLVKQMKFQKYFHKFIIKAIIRGYKIFKKEKLLNNYYQLELDI